MIFEITRKLFIEFRRDKISVVLLFLFPLFFLFIFYMAFGTVEIGGLTTYDISIINEDSGIPELLVVPDDISTWKDTGVGANLTSTILDATYGESQKIYNHINLTSSEVELALKEGIIDMVMYIPEDYSLMVLNQINIVYGNSSLPLYPTNVNATIEFKTHNSIDGEIATAIAKEIIDTYHQSIQSGVIPDMVQIEVNSVLQAEIDSIFDYIASGILVFSTILAASYFAAMLLTDVSQDTIQRIRISSVKPYEYVFGFLIYSFILVMIQQIALIFSARFLFGFNPPGSYFRAYLILLLSSLPMYALIYTAATVFDTSDTAGSVIGFSSSILGFASGAFFEMPRVVLIQGLFWFRSSDPDFLLWDIVPWRHGVDAIRAVFLFDRTLADVWSNLFLLVVMSLIWLAIAFSFYMKRIFRMEN